MRVGKNFKSLILTIILLGLGLSRLDALPSPGTNPKYPINFSHIANWLNDPRHSLSLFEETLKTDLLAMRYNNYWYDKPSYLLWENGAVYEANIRHTTFQAMLWGPLFTTAVWEVPMLAGDLLLVVAGVEPFLYELPIEILMASLDVHEGQAQEKVPVSGLFRINVLFTSDLLHLELKRFGGSSHAKSEDALLGNTYAGLAFKFLESNYFFAGFNFLHIPRIAGWQEFLSTSEGFRDLEGIPIHSDGSVLYETRARMFLYNNLLDFFQFKALLNLAGDKLLDVLGIGFKFEIANLINFEPLISFLSLLGKWSFDLNTAILLDESFYLTYSHHLAVKPFIPFDYVKLGAVLNLIFDESEYGISALQLSGQAVTWRDHSRGRQWGANWKVGFEFPLSIRIKFGISYNMDETMLLVPFASDDKIYSLELEIGMDNNLDYRFNPKSRGER